MNLLQQLAAVGRDMDRAILDSLDRWLMGIHAEASGTRGVELPDGRRGPFCATCRRWTCWPCAQHSLAVGRIRDRQVARRG